MSIKVRNVTKGTIKTIDKSKTGVEKTKDNIVNIKDRSENAYNSNESSANAYAINRLSSFNKSLPSSAKAVSQLGNKSLRDTKTNLIKTKDKVKTIKSKLTEKKKIKKATKEVKAVYSKIKKEKKVAQETVKATRNARKLAKEATKRTYQSIKAAVKISVKAVKAIIAGVKMLISAIMAIGWVAILVIIIMCLIGALCSSMYGIFFSGEETSPNGTTMKDAIIECNQEFSDKLESIQNENPHDDYVLDGSVATWQDILTIYTVKVSNGNNEEVITMDDNKKQILKDIYWDMNEITSEVKNETITEQGVNTDELPKEVEKKVLHIKITSKSADQMKNEYQFNSIQIKQYNELNSNEYASLWNSVIYGINSGEYTNWRQKDAMWSNIRIGNTNSTIGDIGCLVTSIAILIEKSGVDTNSIIPFNPGTFVEVLNNNGGFDSKGNLYYAPINKVVPNFKYVGNIVLRNKSKEEKLATISKYLNDGYYLTVEVKGATPGNQHWVAVIGIDANNVIMVDPATNHTVMWNAYEWSKTSQFNYFKAN